MSPSRYWPRRSVGAILCARIFRQHGSSLPHVTRLIDEFVIESFDERVLRAACGFGAPPYDLEFILSRTTPNWGEVVRAAAKGGYLHVFRWMTQRQDSCGPWKADFNVAVDETARYGHQEIIKWLHERGLGSIHGYAMAEAIAHGHLPVVKWLLHEGVQLNDFDRRQLRLAAQNGHLKTVQWIHENVKDVATSYAMEGVATTGDLEMLHWLHHQKHCSKAFFSPVMNAAVSGGHFHVVEWLFENYSQSCSRYAVEWAAKAGNLPMLQWLHKQYNHRLGSRVMDLAASEGHLETVKWLHDHGSDGCTPYAIKMTARNGHLDLLQWLHANQTEGWTAYVMDLAAGGGHLDIVKWLHENRPEGCTDLSMDQAARNGHAHVLRWLVEHYPDRCGEDLMTVSAWEGHLDVVQYLDENTKQRASGWGLGAAAKRGWMKTLLVLMQNYYRGSTVNWYGLTAVREAFDEILTHLSDEDATPKSSLWRETMESLELFHSGGYYSCVSLMLERALRRGYLVLAQRFIGLRDESERCKYVAVATERCEIVLLRWLLANGIHIDTSSAIQLATERSSTEYVEVTVYLSEGDRVQLVCAAATKMTLHKLLLWTLENTSFTYDGSRVTIYNAIKQAPSDTIQWLRENMTNEKAREWCI